MSGFVRLVSAFWRFCPVLSAGRHEIAIQRCGTHSVPYLWTARPRPIGLGVAQLVRASPSFTTSIRCATGRATKRPQATQGDVTARDLNRILCIY